MNHSRLRRQTICFNADSGAWSQIPVDANSSHPVPRAFSASCFHSNRAFMFGGSNGNSLGDLWMYDMSLKSFALLYFNNYQYRMYSGNIGEFNKLTSPGLRKYAGCAVSDDGKSIFLYGGNYGAGVQSRDLFAFNLDSFEWAYLSGNRTPSYPICMGVYSSSYSPTGRSLSSMFSLGSDGVCVYGGLAETGKLSNQLWCYNSQGQDSQCPVKGTSKPKADSNGGFLFVLVIPGLAVAVVLGCFARRLVRRMKKTRISRKPEPQVEASLSLHVEKSQSNDKNDPVQEERGESEFEPQAGDVHIIPEPATSPLRRRQ
jgi:hypothetical protein